MDNVLLVTVINAINESKKNELLSENIVYGRQVIVLQGLRCYFCFQLIQICRNI